MKAKRKIGIFRLEEEEGRKLSGFKAFGENKGPSTGGVDWSMSSLEIEKSIFDADVKVALRTLYCLRTRDCRRNKMSASENAVDAFPVKTTERV